MYRVRNNYVGNRVSTGVLVTRINEYSRKHLVRSICSLALVDANFDRRCVEPCTRSMRSICHGRFGSAAVSSTVTLSGKTRHLACCIQTALGHPVVGEVGHPFLVRGVGLQVPLQVFGAIWFSCRSAVSPGSLRRLRQPCSLASCISRLTRFLTHASPSARRSCHTRGLPQPLWVGRR